MNEQIKQRLVGAVVLVSLAVIFIPMLLDGDHHSSMPRFGSNIPAQPDFDFEPLEIPLQPVASIPADHPRVINKSESSEPVAKTKPVTSKPPKPVATTKSSATTGTTAITWVVQAGSFSQSSNALTLRDKLRKNGFTTFVEKYRERGKTSYRVRVGPELKRSNAEKQLARLKSKLKLKGIILEYR